MGATEIVKEIVGGFTGILEGCADGVVGLFQKIFMNPTTLDGVTTYSGISSLGIWTLSFIGIGVGLAILRRVTGKVL